MSFFDNTKIAGWAFFIIGILMVIGALYSIYLGATAEGGLAENIGLIIVAIGGLIAAVLYFIFGNNARKGKYPGKFEILVSYVRIVGVTTVIIGLFTAIGGLLAEGASAVSGVLDIILGLVILFIAKKMDDGKETTFDKIIWIILVVVFLVLFVLALMSIFAGGLAILTGICYAIIYIFMLMYMFDSDVKSKLGM